MFKQLFGKRKTANEENVTDEEIISIVNERQEQGLMEAQEAEMISNVIEFDEKEVRDVMTHRKKVIAVPVDISASEALQFMLDESFSRYPVYRDNIDDIVGIVNFKDLASAFIRGKISDTMLSDYVREPYFVPDTQSLDVLLRSMQKNKIHIAVVADEYGQTAGIVTMEDILEEIVGEIQDEYDDEEAMVHVSGKDSFVVSGEISLDELMEKTGIVVRPEETENFETLNGLLVFLLGHIPHKGERVEVDYEGCHFKVLEIHDKMMTKVKCTKKP